MRPVRWRGQFHSDAPSSLCQSFSVCVRMPAATLLCYLAIVIILGPRTLQRLRLQQRFDVGSRLCCRYIFFRVLTVAGGVD